MILPPKSNVAAYLPQDEVYHDVESDEFVRHQPRILVVDDDAQSLNWMSDCLAREGYPCATASNRDGALDVLRSQDCDVVVCNVPMEGVSGFDLLDQLKSLRPFLPVIVGTADGSIAEAVEAVKRGAYQYIPKPYDIRALVDFVQEAVAATQGPSSTLPPRQVPSGMHGGGLVHRSVAMRELVELIALAARSNAPVLIFGESGSGKERVARAIHSGGPRANEPFVAVNSAAIPEALIESEVFGHVRGAFTGATQARRGLLLEANGGTLLLDEIGDMPVMLQPKLLRVLQFGETRPVGSDRFGHVDVRMIAATHRDLDVMVREGRFRDDLRYRLNVIQLIVPPLRERRDDIIPLVVQFLQEARARTPDSPVHAFSDDAMGILVESAWPGNVRELENTVERMVVLGREEVISPDNLDSPKVCPLEESWWVTGAAPWTLRQMNQRYLDWILASTKGDKVRAAGILKVNLSTLYRWARVKR